MRLLNQADKTQTSKWESSVKTSRKITAIFWTGLTYIHSEAKTAMGEELTFKE